MKIRTQLLLAFLLLSVLPLSGIVLYSYFSSLEAVRQAYAAEAKSLTRDMDDRMAAIRRSLDQRVSSVGKLPVGVLGTRANEQREASRMLVEKLGDAAPLIESLEFIPSATVAPAQPPVAAASPAPGSAPAAPRPESVASTDSQGVRPSAAPVEDDTNTSIVIDVEQLVRQIQNSSVGMPPEASAKMTKALERANEEIRRVDDESKGRSTRRRRIFQYLPRPPARSVDQPPAPLIVDGSGDTTDPESIRVQPAIASPAAGEPLTVAGSSAATTIDPLKPVAPSSERSVQAAEKKAAALEKRMERERAQTSLVFPGDLEAAVLQNGSVVGRVKAQVSAKEILNRVLATSRQEDEIPFAVDRFGSIYTNSKKERLQLNTLPIASHLASAGARSEQIVNNWIIVTSKDPDTGLTFGIARPIRKPIEEVGNTAAKNFGYGLVLISCALLGMLPIANHMTRDVQAVTSGAQRIAQGDLQTRVPVNSGNEFGQLATAFNSMARDLSEHQERLFEGERRRKEQEIEQRVLAAEYTRKSDELEEARRFQLSLLPKILPRHPRFRIAVHMRTATEVGGDYYDFHARPDGALTAVIGDATGHGARAATMVTILKSLFTRYDAASAPSIFMTEAAEAIRSMELGRMAMALTLAKLIVDGSQISLEVCAAGMPPLLILRAADEMVEEISIAGMPLGTLEYDYTTRTVELQTGDVVLMLSDGFPELLNPSGEPLGYDAVQQAFQRIGRTSPEKIIEALLETAEKWSGGAAANDDVTFLVIQVV